MMEAAGIAPVAGVGLVGAGQVDGIKAVIVPDGGRDKADFQLMCRLVCHGFFAFEL